MTLRDELRRRLLRERGVYVKECCDKCGQALGAVSFTRRGETGAWCSRECRGDAYTPGICQGCGAVLTGRRRGSKWCGDYCRRNPGSQGRPNRDINPPTPLENKEFTGAKIASLALGLIPASLEHRAH